MDSKRPIFCQHFLIHLEILLKDAMNYQKLLARDPVRKQECKSFYKVTEQGWKWMGVTITSAANFANPFISKSRKRQANKVVSQPSEIEEAYTL